MQSQQFLGVHM